MPFSDEEDEEAQYKAEEAIKAADDKLEEAIRERIKVGNSGALIALTRFATWVPGMFPFKQNADGADPTNDKLERAPFVSENYLYNLLGKEDARTFLALFNDLCQAIGVEHYRDLQQKFFQKRAERDAEEKERLSKIIENHKKAVEAGHGFQKDAACEACIKKWGEEQLQKRYGRTNLCYHRALPAIAERAQVELAEFA